MGGRATISFGGGPLELNLDGSGKTCGVVGVAAPGYSAGCWGDVFCGFRLEERVPAITIEVEVLCLLVALEPVGWRYEQFTSHPSQRREGCCIMLHWDALGCIGERIGVPSVNRRGLKGYGRQEAIFKCRVSGR